MASHMPQLRGESGVGLGGHSRGKRFRHSGLRSIPKRKKTGMHTRLSCKIDREAPTSCDLACRGDTHSRVLVVQYRFRGGQTFLAARGGEPGKTVADDAWKLHASRKDCAEG